MRDWMLTDEGDRWTVKLDVQDLRGHLDTTSRGWSATLATRVRLVVSRAVHVLYPVLCVVLRPPIWRKLRSSLFKVAWSRRQPLANMGAVLSVLDGPQGCDPAYFVVWFRFRMVRGYIAYRPDEVGVVYHLLGMVTEGCPGHGPVHLPVESASEVGFGWDLDVLGWARPGLSSHVRERDEALLRGVLVGGVWNGFLLSRVRVQPVPCQFCGGADGDGHLFWERGMYLSSSG